MGGTVRNLRYVAFLLLISSASAMAQIRPPTITSVSPAGVQRGNTITLTVEGANLADASAILFFPSTIVGTIGRSGDEDLFEFEAEAGKTVVFEIQAAALGSPLDAELTLLDAEAKVLAYNNDYNGRADSFLAYTFSQSGTYRIRVNDSAGAGSSRHFYRLNIGALSCVTRV